MSAATPEPHAVAGRLIAGRYRVVRTLGSGGMANVYEATDEKLGRRVAIKELHEHLLAHDAPSARFGREAMAVAAVNHPGIVAIYDSVPGDADRGIRPALVMEFVDGRTLREFLDFQGALEPADVVTLGTALCDSLEAVHRAGLVHRDLTPTNVLLCRTGEVKLADFGIAKTIDTTDLTATGAFVGTARYLSPEQLTDDEVDARSDLYTLGLILFEAVTGRRAFAGDNDAAAAVARLDHDPPEARAVDASVPVPLSDAIGWALRRNAADRPQRAADLAAALLAAEVPGGAPAAEPRPDRPADQPPFDATDEMPRPVVPPTPAPTPASLVTPNVEESPAARATTRRRPRVSTVFAVVVAAAAVLTVLSLIGVIG